MSRQYRAVNEWLSVVGEGVCFDGMESRPGGRSDFASDSSLESLD